MTHFLASRQLLELSSPITQFIINEYRTPTNIICPVNHGENRNPNTLELAQ